MGRLSPPLRPKQIMKIVKIVFQLGIFTVLLGAAFLLITSKTNKVWGLQSFVVLTGSMQPTISEGSVIFTQKQPTYTKGDIIAFKQGNITVTHRVIEVNKDRSFITKGDANNSLDSKPVVNSDVLGKEVLSVPSLGKFLLLLKTVPGFVVFVILPALLFIGAELLTIKREFTKEIEKKFITKINIG